MALPRFVVLKTREGKFLEYLSQEAGEQVHGFLRFSGKEVMSPYVKLGFEVPQTGNGLVHIKSCYNNKYWRRRSDQEHWLIAEAEKPEEDQSKWSCTLFEPFYDGKEVRLRHVQLESFIITGYPGDVARNYCLVLEPASTGYYYEVINWQTLVILPKHVTFKGDNGYYLASVWRDGGYQYLEFSSDDVGDERVAYEVISNPDGSIRLWSKFFQQYWRRSPNWIWADTDDTSCDNPDTIFWPVKVGDNIIALRNAGNNYFCKRLTTEGKTSCLNAAVSTITKEARLQVEELVVSRKIYNFKYRLSDAKIYNEIVNMMATGEATNMSKESDAVQLSFAYEEQQSKTWTWTFSLKLGVETTITAGIPCIEKNEIKVSAEFTVQYELGNTVTTTTKTETTYSVVVPSMTKVQVSLLATKGSCDVPYSYTVCDTLYDGRQIIYNRDDGLYTGINCFNFTYQTKEVKLS